MTTMSTHPFKWDDCLDTDNPCDTVTEHYLRRDIENLRAALEEAIDIIVTAGVNDEREDVARIRAIAEGGEP